jgi:hypothetical protein
LVLVHKSSNVVPFCHTKFKLYFFALILSMIKFTPKFFDRNWLIKSTTDEAQQPVPDLAGGLHEAVPEVAGARAALRILLRQEDQCAQADSSGFGEIF